MSTDPPLGGSAAEAEAWDAERVRAYDERAVEQGTELLWAAALHRESGEIAAFTILARLADHFDSAAQNATLVNVRHRGRRLGMTVKSANLVQARDNGVARVHTWNAHQNEHMLAINTALGFQPSGVCNVRWPVDAGGGRRRDR